MKIKEIIATLKKYLVEDHVPSEVVDQLIESASSISNQSVVNEAKEILSLLYTPLPQGKAPHEMGVLVEFTSVETAIERLSEINL